MNKIPRCRRILYFLLVVISYGVYRIHKLQVNSEREDFMRHYGPIYQRGDAVQRFVDFAKSNHRLLDITQETRNQAQLTKDSRTEALTRGQSLFTNALYKISMGMDKEVVYQELLSSTSELKNKPEVARQLKCFLWVYSDCSVAHTNFLTRLSIAKAQYINPMFDEMRSWSFPVNPGEIMTNAYNAINWYKRENENYISIVTTGTNTLAKTLGENSAVGNRYIDILLHFSKESPASRFYDIWIEEASVLAEVGRMLSSSKKWQMVNGVPICEDVSLYKSLLRMADSSDIAWNKSLVIFNELPQIIAEGGFEREKNATRQAFECANQRDIKSIFGIRLGVPCKVFKRSEHDLGGVAMIDKVNYEQELLSDIRSGCLKVKLPLKFHSINSVKLYVDKFSHRIYEIEGEGDFSITEKELSKILEQIEEKYAIVMSPVKVSPEMERIVPDRQYRYWEYQAPKYAKVLKVEYSISSGHVIIKLKDLQLSKLSKESEKRLEEFLDKAAL